MAIAAVNAWLRVRGDFKQGVALLREHGGAMDKTTRFVLSLGDNPHSRKTLTEKLTAIDGAFVKAAVAATPKSTRPGTGKKSKHQVDLDREAEDRTNGVGGKTNITEQELPPTLRPLRRRVSDLHNTRTYLKGSLLRIANGKELGEVALKIKEIRTQIKAGWLVLEAYRHTGQIVDLQTAPLPPNNAEMHRRLNTVETYLSRANTGKRKASPEKLAAWLQEKDRLKAALNEPVHAG